MTGEHLSTRAMAGSRARERRRNGSLIEATKRYKVAGWAPVSEEAGNTGGEPIRDMMA